MKTEVRARHREGEQAMDGDSFTSLLLKQTVKQAKCDSTGHRKEKAQKQALREIERA
jgi:hypothetical protein